jgi:hypothetical protein
MIHLAAGVIQNGFFQHAPFIGLSFDGYLMA